MGLEMVFLYKMRLLIGLIHDNLGFCTITAAASGHPDVAVDRYLDYRLAAL
jgi:uncharacterized membrane protein YtjA (UPF0391 family)